MSHRSPPPNYKTVKLSCGKHSSPTDGACVMELSSMIAGESFTDQPQCVCPVIAAFLRAYNDALDDRRRQDLYGYAARVIGTRSTPEIERSRIERVVSWAGEMRASRNRLARLFRRVDLGLRPPSSARAAASLAVNAIGRRSDSSHARALSLVDELCAIGTVPAAPVKGRWRAMSCAQPAAGTGDHGRELATHPEPDPRPVSRRRRGQALLPPSL
jgi:hypothetical protein